MTGFSSFEPLLRRVMKLLPSEPEILEWGPGFSTGIMVQERPRALIDTVEHDEYWFNVYKQKYADFSNIRIHYVPDFPEYWVRPTRLGKTFDLIFVDGTERIECLKVAYQLVKKGGWVMLHDSERLEYHNGVKLFKVLHEEGDTTAMIRSEYP